MKIKKSILALMLLVIVSVLCIGNVKGQGYNVRKLTKDELTNFSTFLTKNENNGFLKSIYTTPNEIDLTMIFRDGAGLPEEKIGDEEKADYIKAAGIDELYTGLVKVTTTQIKEVFKEKTNTEITDIKSKLKDWTYIEKYDAYYNMYGDSSLQGIECIDGVLTSDGYYLINYKSKNDETLNLAEKDQMLVKSLTVTIVKNGDSYIFVKNQKPEDVDLTISKQAEENKNIIEGNQNTEKTNSDNIIKTLFIVIAALVILFVILILTSKKKQNK